MYVYMYVRGGGDAVQVAAFRRAFVGARCPEDALPTFRDALAVAASQARARALDRPGADVEAAMEAFFHHAAALCVLLGSDSAAAGGAAVVRLAALVASSAAERCCRDAGQGQAPGQGPFLGEDPTLLFLHHAVNALREAR
jgi:hypothetical protein